MTAEAQYTASELAKRIRSIDGRGYRSYKQLKGGYRFDGWSLFIDHVQGDPFATPSKMRLRVSQSEACFPSSLFANVCRRIALEDVLAREVRRALPKRVRDSSAGSGNSGLVTIDAGGQEALERTAFVVNEDFVEARIEVGLPAAGRTVLGRRAAQILLEELDDVVRKALFWQELDADAISSFVDVIENQEHLRSLLEEHDLVAFIADGALLPRQSGASDLPMDEADAVRFRAPESLRVELPLLHARPSLSGREERSVTGLGVPKGVTLVVGGGYHGKSTLLRALERAVYPHVPADGRELVVTRGDAVKIRAEDGRRVERVDISGFIRDLPGGRPTASFSTVDASGSTSQAANIVEALEVGSRLLLVDEDTSATNFMVRDARMQALVEEEGEPIVPFVDRVRELYERFSVSTILVMGGSGDYLEKAQTVVRMRDYVPEDVTVRAHEVARDQPSGRRAANVSPFPSIRARSPEPLVSPRTSIRERPIKIDSQGRDHIRFGRETIDLRALEQITDASQARAIGQALRVASERTDPDSTLATLVDGLEQLWDERGLDVLAPRGDDGEHPGSFARPRRFEVAGAWNRLRSAQMQWAVRS